MVMHSRGSNAFDRSEGRPFLPPAEMKVAKVTSLHAARYINEMPKTFRDAVEDSGAKIDQQGRLTYIRARNIRNRQGILYPVDELQGDIDDLKLGSFAFHAANLSPVGINDSHFSQSLLITPDMDTIYTYNDERDRIFDAVPFLFRDDGDIALKFDLLNYGEFDRKKLVGNLTEACGQMQLTLGRIAATRVPFIRSQQN